MRKWPHSWTARPLGEFVSRAADLVSPDRSAAPDGWYIGLQDIEAGGIGIASPRPYGTASDVHSTKSRFRAGDILYGRLRPYLNKVWLADRDGLCTTEILVLRCLPSIDPLYLSFLMRSSPFVQAASDLQKGANLPRVSFGDLSRIPVHAPPTLAEQEYIAGVLDEANTARTLAAEAKRDAQRLSNALFLKMFGDPALNPMNWPTSPLGIECRVIRGASPRPKGDPRYFGGPVPWIKISDATREASRWLTVTSEGLTREGAERSVQVEPGTLLLTNSATVGLPKVLGISGCIHDGFLAFTELRKRLQRDYLYGIFLVSRQRLINLAPHGTQRNLNTKILKNLAIPIPPPEEQRRYVSALSEVDSLQDALEDSRDDTEALYQSVSLSYFGGLGFLGGPTAALRPPPAEVPGRRVWTKLSPMQREVWALCLTFPEPFGVEDLGNTLRDGEMAAMRRASLTSTLDVLVALGAVIKVGRDDADLWRRPDPEFDGRVEVEA
jgi:type I restriction enzyme S subunit